jgi:hypothetical protein
MFDIEADKSKNLLKFVFSGHVTAVETRRWREQLDVLLNDLQPGFKLLSDLSPLDLMDADCVTDIEWSMDRLNAARIAKVVRVIPDPHKDIGLSIMSVFHYRRCVSIVTCETLEEALKALED